MNSLISKIPTEPISFREIKNRPLEIRSKNFRETKVQQLTLNQSQGPLWPVRQPQLTYRPGSARLRKRNILFTFLLHDFQTVAGTQLVALGWFKHLL